MRDNIFIAEYFETQGCLNLEQGINLWHLLNQVLLLDIPGDVVELGSLTGRTAAVIQRTLEDFGSDKRLVLFDSFEGLPPILPEDGNCPLKPENFKTDPEHTLQRFRDLGLRQPQIVPGWFHETLEKHLPERVSFAHLDGDLYSSTADALKVLYPRLSPGAVVLVDDYAEDSLCAKIVQYCRSNPYTRGSGRKISPKTLSNWLPGVRKACEEFLADKPEEMFVLLAGEERHAFFRKI